MPDADLKKRLELFQELFVEARLSIEECKDAAGTKYFDEEAEAATEAVAEAVAAFSAILNDVHDQDQKNRVLRGNGLKIEQLKGELDMAIKGGHDHWFICAGQFASSPGKRHFNSDVVSDLPVNSCLCYVVHDCALHFSL